MFSSRARELEISGIRRMFEAAPPGTINLGLGEPDFSPPAAVQEALFDAVRKGYNKYGPSAGILPLRDALAQRYRRWDGRTARESVVITQGGTEALAACALTLYEVGDEVLVPNPGFVLYAPHARMAGAVPVPYPLDEAKGYQPDLDALESRITSRTRALVVNSPSNPTGTVYSPRVVDRLVDLARDHDLTILSDEVYDEILYVPQGHRSFWGRYDRVVVVNSFSKLFAMTGWRLGYLVAPPAVAQQVNKVHYHLVACPSTPVQMAALAGLSAPPRETTEMVREFRARRDLFLRGLKQVRGLRCVTPEGAFYAFPRIDWVLSPLEAAQALLQRGLLCTPGDSFGSLGEGHLRMSFATSQEHLRRALRILEEFGEERVSRGRDNP